MGIRSALACRRLTTGALVIVNVMMLTAGPISLPAQGSITVSSVPSCAQCRIALERFAVLGDVDGPGMLVQQARVIADSRRRFYVASPVDPSRVVVFDSGGRYVRALGRAGGGHGEFRDVPLIVPTGDSLVAFDPAARRATVFGPGHEVIRFFALPVAVTSAVPFPDGGVLVAGEGRSRTYSGIPMLLLDSAGRTSHPVGADDETLDLDNPYGSVRIVGKGPQGTAWSARLNEYLIERWDRSGQRIMSVRRMADWFQPWTRVAGIPRLVRPQPRITDVRQIDNHLWVLIQVADANWRAREGKPVPGMKGATVTPDADKELIFDTIVEVIDLSTNRLLASHRLSQHILGFVDDGLVASYAEDAQGNPRYAVWRLKVIP